MTNEKLIERLTRPIIGIENRTAQEAFDMMVDRIRSIADDANGNVVHLPDEANAHLIAAARELYAAAERALNYITNTEGEFGITFESGDMLRAALAKARGDQQ